MSVENKNIIIVGGGLAGICVAIQLIKSGAKITLYDKEENHSSIVAGGIINPLVFRRMTKSWRVDAFLPYLKSFYGELEKETNTSFLNPLPIRRLFSSIQERDFWLEKQDQEEFKRYMFPINQKDSDYKVSLNEFGSGRVNNSYAVQVETFMDSGKQWIKLNEGEIISENFDYSCVESNAYKGLPFDDIIFCEGFESKNNPWFGELPLDQTKGQTLTVHSNELPTDVSLNRKCFVLPLTGNTFKIGSTYEWHNASTNITNEAKVELLNNLTYITKEKVEVVSQEAGIRPTTRDRRPLIGTHPDFSNYHIFNGLGAKGYMLAPLLSSEFVTYLSNDADLDKEVNVLRYFNKD